MNDQPPPLEDAAVKDLVRLSKGKGADAQQGLTPATLQKCKGLLNLILDKLDLQGSCFVKDQLEVLHEILLDFVSETRQSALEQFNHETGVKSGPGIKVCAAAELLNLTDQRFLEEVRTKYGIDRTWKRGSLQGHRQQRAAVCLGGISLKRVQQLRRSLLGDFVENLSTYVDDDDRKNSLRRRLLERLKPSLPTDAPTVPAQPIVRDTRERTTADVRPQPSLRDVDPKLYGVIHDFAVQLRNELEDEQAANKVDEGDFPLRWTALDDVEHVDDWRSIRKYFGRTDGGGPLGIPSEIEELAELLQTSPAGRLVVLGQGGAGKTTLAAELALALLGRGGHTEGRPIPVIFNLPSWNPEKQRLSEWLIDELETIHRLPSERGKTRGGSRAAQLVEGNHILPILDGFDEMVERLRVAAIKSIQQLSRSKKFVLLSRQQEYRHAVAKSYVLPGAAVMLMQDLELGDVEDYLSRRTKRQDDWKAVFSYIKSNREAPRSKVLQAVFATPLMAMLAGVIYRRDYDPDKRRDPLELINVEKFGSVDAMTNHLLDAFVKARFENPSSPNSKPWRYEDARKWLGFAATLLVAENNNDFAWWKISGRLFRRAFQFLAGLFLAPAIAVAVGGLLVALAASTWVLSAAAAIIALGVFMLVLLAATEAEPRRFGWENVKDFYKQLSHNDLTSLGLIYHRLEHFIALLFILVGILAWVSGFVWTKTGAPGFFEQLAILAGIFATSFFIWAVLLVTPEEELKETPTEEELKEKPAAVVSPYSVLHADQIAAIKRSLVYAGPLWFLCVVFWVAGSYTLFPAALLILASAVLMACCSAAVAWFVARVFLAFRGMLPWRCMGFLMDARKRGVLRQAGAVYQFRHVALRNNLALHFVKEEVGEFFKDSKTVLRARRNLAVWSFNNGTFSYADSELLDILVEQAHGSDREGYLETWFALIEVLREKGNVDEAINQLCSLRASNVDFYAGQAKGMHYKSQLLLVGRLSQQKRYARAEGEYSALRHQLRIDAKGTGPLAGLAEYLQSELPEKYATDYEEYESDYLDLIRKYFLVRENDAVRDFG